MFIKFRPYISPRTKIAATLLCSLVVLSACSRSDGDNTDTLNESDVSVPTNGDVAGNENEALSAVDAGQQTDQSVIDEADVQEGDSATTDNAESEAGNSESSTNPAVTIDHTPIVRAPADEQIIISEILALDGTVTNSTDTNDTPIVLWTKNLGPGNVVFFNPQSAQTQVTFDTAGTYELELSGRVGSDEATDSVRVIVMDVVANQAPTVTAGPNQTLVVNEVLDLSAQAEDDGLPSNTLSVQWSKTAGAGAVTFGETSALETTATFSAAGEYVLNVSVSDGKLSTSDSIDVSVAALPVNNSSSNVSAQRRWESVNTSNGSLAQARHEAAAVAFQNQLYLLGGRGIRQVNRYNPNSNSWANLGVADRELSHFQPVVQNGKIYVLGSLEGKFPSEDVISRIQIFDPATQQWSEGASLPANRLRGSAGTVTYNSKIYMIGGTTNGHDGGMVNWFDEYTPATNTWRTLPNAPNARDHFSAAMVGNKLVAAGGRQTDHPATFQNLVTAVDVYDFDTGRWKSGAPIPTRRAGAMTVSHGDEVILIGGESDRGVPALDTVEAYNVETNSWRTLDSLGLERHSGGAAIVGGAIHVVSGNTTTGGGNETQSHEKLDLD